MLIRQARENDYPIKALTSYIIIIILSDIYWTVFQVLFEV